MADTTYSPKVYKKNGGDTMVVASGGTVQFESGATLQLDAGSIATLADEILAAGDIALAENSFLVGNAGGAAEATTAANVLTLLGGTAGVAAGYKIARGQHTTVDEDDTVATGLATVVSVVASLDSDPVAGAQFVTATKGNQAGAPAAGSIQIKTWKATAAGDTALIPATTFSKLVNWIAIGT
jgi:hypothetical protein